MQHQDPMPLVLVVVHNKGDCQIIEDALRARHLDTMAADSGREALAALQRYPVAAVVVDSQLPVMGGVELAKSIRKHDRGNRVQILLITEVQWPAAQRAAVIQQWGLLDLMLKPFALEDLVEKIATQLHGELSGKGAPSLDGASYGEIQHVERVTSALASDKTSHRGNLQSEPFPELLHRLYRQRVDGALFLLKDNVKKIVYFKNGSPAYVKSNLLSECLGKVLVREGMISEAECQESLERMKAVRRQQGTVLIEMGVISPQNLVVGLELQLRHKLLDVFSWTRGDALLKLDVSPLSETVSLGMSTAGIIADGVERSWSAERLTDALQPQQDQYWALTENPELRFQELPLDSQEQAFVDEIDGTKTLRQILDAAALPPGRALWVAYVLWSTAIVESSPAPRLRGERQAIRSSMQEVELSARRALASELLSLKNCDAYGALGISPSASDAEIEKAYATRARRYHGDLHRHLPKECRDMAREAFELLHQAYRQVGTMPKRQRYNRRLSTLEMEAVSRAGGRSLRAEEFKSRAESLIEARDWDSAARELEQATELCSEAGDLWALRGWVTYRVAPKNNGTVRQALYFLRQAVALDPHFGKSYLYLGWIYRETGRVILAEKQFEKAVQCDPSCAEALVELTVERKNRAKSNLWVKKP